MIKYLIDRPIAVFMTFTAFFILGIITYLNIPVSLLPNIPIPEISVHITAVDNSARQLENSVVAPLRRQLLQVNKLREIKSEARDGSAVIRLNFEYGVDTELAFVEVNEKIDAAMQYIPRGTDRPRVVKASATDIPVFNLNLTLKDTTFSNSNFLLLCELSEMVIRRRIEQLPQVALVDMTGLMHEQVLVRPDENKLKISGITLSDIESALSNNNIEPGSMMVKDGYYEYNIKFSAVMRTIEDMQNIYIRKNDKIYQLKDMAKVEIVPQKETGMAFYNGRRAVTLSVIKQADENMDDLKNEVDREIVRMQRNYPDVQFNISQNQTELLDYSISNLQQNLLLAFVFILFISALFMRDVRSPMIIGVSIFVSLIISFIFFYLFKVSLNVVSLTGLILALGMMIDSSIIVTDNIGQHRKNGCTIDEACIRGTNEVITPMLSSSFTTIAVFFPLVFLSGIAGAVFFDQAFSVTIGLLVSYVTGILLLPVLYKIVFSMHLPAFLRPFAVKIRRKSFTNSSEIKIHEKVYHQGVNWVFKHKVLTLIIMLAVLPLSYWLFTIIPKQKMPEIQQNELIVKVEWNENIHIEENAMRVQHFIKSISAENLVESSALVGQQQFLLQSDNNQTSSESEIYLKVDSEDKIHKLESNIRNYFRKQYPNAVTKLSPPENIFEKIFSSGDPELVVEYYAKNSNYNPTVSSIRMLEKEIVKRTGDIPVGISFQKQLNIDIDKQKAILYGASYNDIYQVIKTGFTENNFSVLRSNQQYLPIILGGKEKSVQEVIDRTMIFTSTDENSYRNSAPLSAFVDLTQTEDLKTIKAGGNGEFIPFYFYKIKNPEHTIETLKKNKPDDLELNFSGTFFSNKKMLSEMVVILLISILLMYFILTAQFEGFALPFIVLLEIPIDVTASLLLLDLTGHSLNLMSAIGIVVSCGIIINDSILKVDMMNELRKSGMPLMKSIHEAGHRRLNAILMTTLTSIVCMLPLLFSYNLGAELEKPLAIALIGGMLIGTPVSLFVVPLAYWWIYRKEEINQ